MGSSSLKINEPSMEEILASIRRIISDDQEEPHPSDVQEPSSSPLKNVLDIAERHVSPLIGTQPNEPVLGPWSRGEVPLGDSLLGDLDESDLAGLRAFGKPEEPASVPIMGPEPVQKRSQPKAKVEPEEDDMLLSPDARTAISGAFGRLSGAVKPAQPQTVEDLMKEMLRPMLKAWLDDNLPSLVERLVRAEIERVTRGRG